MNTRSASDATCEITYDISCGAGEHPITLEATLWGDVQITSNPCDAPYFSWDSCHRTIDTQLTSSRVFYQQFLVDPRLDYESTNLPTRLRSQLQQFWSKSNDDLIAVAEAICAEAGFTNVFCDPLESDELAHCWAWLMLVQKMRRTDLVADVQRKIHRLPLPLGAYAACVLDELAQPASLSVLGDWARNRDVIAPLRERFIAHLPAIGGAKAIPFLVDNQAVSTVDWRPDYPPLDEIPATAERMLRELLMKARRKSPESIRATVIEILLDTRSCRPFVFKLLTEVVRDARMWLELLEHFRWRVRIGSLHVLAELRDPKTAEPIVALLESGPPLEVRKAAETTLTSLLSDCPRSRIVKRLLPRIIQIPSVPVVEAAGSMLEHVAKNKAVAVLITGLENRNPHAVGCVAAKLSDLAAAEAIPALLETLRRDLPGRARQQAATTLLKLIREPATPPASNLSYLVRGLSCDNDDVAIACVERMGKLDSKEAFAALCDAIGDVTPSVQIAIAGVLQRRRDARALQALLPAVELSRGVARQRMGQAANSLLRQLQETRTDIDLAVQALYCAYSPLAIEAAIALRRIGDESVLADLADIASRRPGLADAVRETRRQIIGEHDSENMGWRFVRTSAKGESRPRSQLVANVIRRLRSAGRR